MMPDDFERARWMEDYRGEFSAVVLAILVGGALGVAGLVGLLCLVVWALS